MDEVFLNGSVEDKAAFVRENRDKIAELENRIQKYEPERISQLDIAI